jgi:hypothetical protein
MYIYITFLNIQNPVLFDSVYVLILYNSRTKQFHFFEQNYDIAFCNG